MLKRAILCGLLGALLTPCGAEGRDALAQLNWRRARVGLAPYRADPQLQAAAENSAQAQARTGRMFHSRHIGSRSGVGMTSIRDPQGRRFQTCYAFSRHAGYAGAAAAVGRNGRTFYALDIRDGPSRGSARRSGGGKMCYKCSKCGKTHCR